MKLVQERQLKAQSKHCYVNTLRQGDLSSLCWQQGPLDQSTNGELVRVQFSALNYRDVQFASGRLTAEMFDLNRLEKDCMLGLEYSGTTLQGQKVGHLETYSMQ